MTFDPLSASALEIAAAVRSHAATALSITEACLARIAATHLRINAFTTVTAERARAEAASVDATVSAGGDPGPLAGVPYGVKNLFDLAGVVTVAGSKIHRDHPPAARDATSVARLQKAGAVCVGALNMGEYAYDFTTENVHDGSTHNPHDLARSAGGSSGGSSAAVAGGLVPLTLGTDTNGSIRVPSSFCGIWGLKPTYSRLSRAGGVLFVESLDHIGPFARNVADLAVAYDALQGPDPADPVCTQRPPEFALPVLEQGLGSLRLAMLGGYFAKGGLPEVHEAVEWIAAALGVARSVELPTPELARAAAYTISAVEGGHRHLPDLKSRAADFDPNTRDRFLAGALMPASWYLQAQKFRAIWREKIKAVFREVDVLIAPATPVPATLLGQQTMTLDGVEMLVRPNLGVFTQPISFAGLPVVAAPLHLPGRAPIAVQLIGAPWSETALLRTARVLEKLGVCRAPIALLDF